VRAAAVGVDIRTEMAAEGIVLVCPPDADVLDESKRAYKDIEDVMHRQRDLVEPVVKLRPLGVTKG
jgi:tRNA-splicing ligase RtcB